MYPRYIHLDQVTLLSINSNPVHTNDEHFWPVWFIKEMQMLHVVVMAMEEVLHIVPL